VRLKDKTNTWSQKATVINEVHPRSYTLKTEEGAVLRRNRQDIMGPATADQRGDAAAEQPGHSKSSSPEAPVPVQDLPFRRSSRAVKPPQRLNSFRGS
jgi:hypothetical protein